MIAALILTELRGHHMRATYPAITHHTDLRDDLRMDSLDFVSLAIALEMSLGIEVPDSAAFQWRTVGDVVRWVEKVNG